jgi:hypothetical protein
MTESVSKADIQRNATLSRMMSDQLRVLIAVGTVAATPGSGGKMGSLTKLAKIDFLARHADYEDAVARHLGLEDSLQTKLATPTVAPRMIRYKYGPWDSGYYSALGALFGMDLLRYTRGQRGSVAMRLTSSGKKLLTQATSDVEWGPLVARFDAVAKRYGTLSGNELKNAIYSALPELLDVPHRSELS